MFYDREDCTRLSFFPDDYGTPSGVFLFKGFYTDEECKIVEDALKEYKYDDVYEQTLISWYADKLSPPIRGLHKLWEKASDLLYPEYVIHPQNNVLVISEHMKQGMFTHSDSPGKGECHRLSQVDVWKTCCELDYGLVAYFGDFEGGEIFYVNINEDGSKKDPDVNSKILEFKPERGDLVVHGAFSPHTHGVKEVTKGVRYAFSNFVLKAEDNPGTFYNYKTPEYYEQIKDVDTDFEKFQHTWMQPLKQNPQFTDERIKMLQASGLEGVELANAFPFDHDEVNAKTV
jgi:hypothetical protein